MKNRLPLARVMALTLLGLILGGCATYYPAGGDRGVYYEVPQYRTARAVYVDPLVYPYWSLDYFYYSRYYHPYSVVVHRFDPWYYPYPGWYYGYWPGPRFIGHGGRFHYPWYRYGDRYAGYHPWRSGAHLSFGYDRPDRGDGARRVDELDARLRELQTQRSLAVRSQRPNRQLVPAAAPWLPATGRGEAGYRSRGGAAAPTDARRRGLGDRQVFLERLRANDRDARLPDRSARQRTPVLPTAGRDERARQPDIGHAPPSRQRPDEPSPPRGQPQRRPQRQSTQPPRRPSPPPRQNRSKERERR